MLFNRHLLCLSGFFLTLKILPQTNSKSINFFTNSKIFLIIFFHYTQPVLQATDGQMMKGYTVYRLVFSVYRFRSFASSSHRLTSLSTN
jgi:hypothetical protein